MILWNAEKIEKKTTHLVIKLSFQMFLQVQKGEFIDI